MRIPHPNRYQILPTLTNQKILIKNQQNQHHSAKERQTRIKKLMQNLVFLSDLSSQHQQNIRINSYTDHLIQFKLFGRVQENPTLQESIASPSKETSQSKRSLPSQAESSKSAKKTRNSETILVQTTESTLANNVSDQPILPISFSFPTMPPMPEPQMQPHSLLLRFGNVSKCSWVWFTI